MRTDDLTKGSRHGRTAITILYIVYSIILGLWIVSLYVMSSGFWQRTLFGYHIEGFFSMCVLVTTLLNIVVGLGVVFFVWKRKTNPLLRGVFTALVTVSIIIVGVHVVAEMRPRGPGEAAKRAVCMHNLKQIGLGCHMYAQHNDGIFPDKLSRLYPDYVPDLKIFICPSTDDEISSADKIEEDGSYVYVSGLGKFDHSDKVIAYDKPDNHHAQGRNELYVDGHVEWKAIR